MKRHRVKPIRKMSADEIHTELVSTAVAGKLTPLQRFVEGCTRIAVLRGETPDDAYKAIRAEVLSLGGGAGSLMR